MALTFAFQMSGHIISLFFVMLRYSKHACKAHESMRRDHNTATFISDEQEGQTSQIHPRRTV